MLRSILLSSGKAFNSFSFRISIFESHYTTKLLPVRLVIPVSNKYFSPPLSETHLTLFLLCCFSGISLADSHNHAMQLYLQNSLLLKMSYSFLENVQDFANFYVFLFLQILQCSLCVNVASTTLRNGLQITVQMLAN